MKISFFLIILFVYSNSYGQGRNANWVFGDSAGIHFNGLNTPTLFKTVCKSNGETATISDTNGNLMFYVNGKATIPDPTLKVYDNDFKVMINGDSVIGDTWYNSDIIIPKPLSDSIYYHFSTTDVAYYNVISKLDKTSPGVVLQKNQLLKYSAMSDCTQAVKHGNGRDWWIITKVGLHNTKRYFFCLAC
nr:hypothetical protein [Bacteroidota bacterium]